MSALTVTTFPGLTARQGKEEHLTWADFVATLKDEVTYISKEACPLFKLGAYEGANRGRGQQLLHVDAIMADYDAEEVSVDEAARRLTRAGVKAVVYTSASHTPEAPRWRVIAALAEPVTDEGTFHQQMDVLNGALGGILAAESWDWRRNYFRGRVGGRTYEVVETAGAPLDELIAFDIAPEPVAPPVRPKKAAEPQVLLDQDDPVARHLIETGWALGQQEDKLFVRCPKGDQHSTPQGPNDTSAAWLAPTTEHPHGSYACRHTTHGPIGRSEFLRLVGYDDPAAQDEWPEPEEFESLVEAKAQAKQEKLDRFKVLPLPEFHSRPHPGWIVKGVLPRAEVVVVYGPPGSGKSFAVLDLVASIARGQPWRGHKVTQERVVYIAAEGAAGFRNRTQAYCLGNGLTDIPELGVIAATPSLLNDDWQLVAAAIGRAGVIVVDTLSSTTAGGDENSAETMTGLIDRCKRLAQATGAVVILVHHSGKDASKGSRGHSSLLGAADAEFEVTKDGTTHLLRNTKQKDGEDGLRWGFALRQLVIGIDADGDEITSCVVIEAEIPVAKVGGRPLSAYGEQINAVIQEMAQAQTTGIEIKAVRDQVKAADPEADHSHFTRVLKVVCERLGYATDGDCISVGGM